MKTVVEADESKQLLSRLDGVAAAVFREMNVPDDAKAVDVLYFFYKEKNGEIKIVEKSPAAQCFNPEFRVFADEENLYLANLEGKYVFPLSSFVKTHTVKKNIRMLGWNKDEPHNKGIYKQYKLGVDDHGCVHCKSYNILEMKLQGEVYGIYIPCYELPVFEEILNGATKK